MEQNNQQHGNIWQLLAAILQEEMEKAKLIIAGNLNGITRSRGSGKTVGQFDQDTVHEEVALQALGDEET